MMAPPDVTGLMDSPAFPVLRAMASKVLQGMRVPLAYPEPRAFQERRVLQDRAYQARRASVVSLETLGCQDLQASLVLQVPLEPQDRQIVNRV